MEPFEREHLRQRQQAMTIAIHTVGWPLVIATFVGLAAETKWFQRDAHIALIVLSALVGLVVLAGTAVGWTAHRIFSGSDIPCGRAAMILSLLIDFTVFGWIIVTAIKEGAF